MDGLPKLACMAVAGVVRLEQVHQFVAVTSQCQQPYLLMCASEGSPAPHDLSAYLLPKWVALGLPRHEEAPHPWLQGPVLRCEVPITPAGPPPIHRLGQRVPELFPHLDTRENLSGDASPPAPSPRPPTIVGCQEEPRN